MNDVKIDFALLDLQSWGFGDIGSDDDVLEQISLILDREKHKLDYAAKAGAKVMLDEIVREIKCMSPGAGPRADGRFILDMELFEGSVSISIDLRTAILNDCEVWSLDGGDADPLLSRRFVGAYLRKLADDIDQNLLSE